MEIPREQEAQSDGQMAHPAEQSAGVPAADADGLVEEHSHRRRYLLAGGVLLWVLAVAGMVALSFLVHGHPQPFPFELSISRAIQASVTVAWLGATFRFLTWINDPIPDLVTVVGVLVVFAVFRWWRQGIFLALSVMVGNGIDALIGDWVQRPRPTPNLIHVDSKLIFNSFPSGHSCHMMVFYGFLLFLTLTRPVSRWRYHWLVLLLQIWAVLNICIMGYARLWEGEHWLLDVLGGYLDGVIWMSLFIFLYMVVTNRVRSRKQRKSKALASPSLAGQTPIAPSLL